MVPRTDGAKGRGSGMAPNRLSGGERRGRGGREGIPGAADIVVEAQGGEGELEAAGVGVGGGHRGSPLLELFREDPWGMSRGSVGRSPTKEAPTPGCRGQRLTGEHHPVQANA